MKVPPGGNMTHAFEGVQSCPRDPRLGTWCDGPFLHCSVVYATCRGYQQGFMTLLSKW